MQQDKSYQKVQQKIVNVTGHLSKIWQLIETAADCNSEKDELNLEDFKNLTEQTIVMLE